MSNQLVIPFKRTTDPPIAEAVREYLAKYHPEVVPDDFEWDITHWETLRSQISNDTVHASIVDATLKYHAQLVLMLTKLPVDIDLPITYYHAFQASQQPLILSNLSYERVCTLFNLAALFSQLAEAQDRSTSDGIRRASGYYQNAAGTYTYLLESGLPPFVASLTHPMSSSDLSKPVVKTLELLMLAQAAECYWQKAVADNLRNGTIARLSMQVATFYGMAYNSLQSAPTLVGSALPSSWLAHMQTKQHHFEAAAQVRKSMDDSENTRYGIQVARLASARIYAKQGQESAKRSVSSAVLEDINALFAWIEDRATAAQRDNDYIYHQEVPPISNLEIIEPANLVNSAILGGLRDPQTSLNGDEALFGKLISWGARTAINVYNERKHNMVATIRQAQQDLDRAATAKLQELNLPNSLELLDRPMALPPSVLAKAAEVRADSGPMRIRQLLEDLDILCTQDRNLLNEVYDILDSEVEEDESYHKRFGVKWPRASSQVANEDLLGKAQHFSSVLEQAVDSDRKVKTTWKEWTTAIEALASDEASLAMLPSTSPTPRGKTSPLTTQTKSHVRILRGHLESLEELRRNRQHALLRAQNVLAHDDISDRIKLVAVGLERWTQVKPEMFDEAMTEELGKYDKYQNEITATKEEQEGLLKKIEERNALLLQSRKDDPVNKNVDSIAKNLNTAYTKYKEIVQNCSDGLTFYNNFAEHLSSLRDSCRQWTYARRKDANSIVEHLELMTLGEPVTQSPITPADEIPPAPTLSPPGSSPTSSPPESPSTSRSSNRQDLTPRSSQPGIITDLPNPNSSQWEPLVPIPAMSPVVSTGGNGSKSKRQSRDGASPSLASGAQSTSTSNGTSKISKPKRQIY